MTVTPQDTDPAPAYPMDRTCPYRMPPGYASLRERRPLSRVTLDDGREVWLISGNAEGRALLRDPRLSSNTSRLGFPCLAGQQVPELPLIGTDDPEHARQRRLLASGFGIRRIAALRPQIERTAEELIDAMLAQGNSAELVRAYSLPLACDASFAFLGVPREERHLLKDLVRSTLLGSPEEETHASGHAFTGIQDYLRELIARKERTPGDGLIDELLAGHPVRDEADRDQLVLLCTVLATGGNETTSATIATSVFALLEHPEQAGMLRTDSTLTAGAVEELTRFISAGDALLRAAVADIEIAGHTIRAGDGVIISTMLMNRDPGAWDDPDVLDIRRRASRHVAFGYGIHQCVGQNLARAEMEIALNTLLRRVPTLRLAVPAGQVRSTPAATQEGVAELPVTW
ncbi:cytochrome P450 [Streptomyces sp. NBC_00984]|uniref:cytochrome P450 n=1 Tax=Streptomyces sp. NBC_00984 TaxID=2903700 RepID=UPI00386F27D8|nr:cytochrome P450 [Streptomyces sp. NBC_00984]